MLSDVRTLRDCERYHCLPSQLDEEDWHELARLRAIAIAEEQYMVQEHKSRQARANAQARRRR